LVIVSGRVQKVEEGGDADISIRSGKDLEKKWATKMKRDHLSPNTT